ncbi:MAG: glycosyl hydrolase family 28 protein [Planctomycetia bacterium]|nr:glycosyl hydrolase family 28 protein [Planctomycetia bacterium]
MSYFSPRHVRRLATVAVLLGIITPAATLELANAAEEIAPGVVGDGVHDDTAGLQALLDSGTSDVHFPSPPVRLLISKTLKIHSGQTLTLARHAVVRLKEHADQILIANADQDRGDENITLVGGVWDMDNVNQSMAEYQKTHNWNRPYDPAFYLGVLMRFDKVKNLCIRGLTLRDPVTFGMQLGNLRQFTIEDITFDYNLQRTNMDGVHVHGNSRWGRIANLKGTTNDDLVALNADDAAMFEMSRGPIEDVSVDGVFSQNGYTAVRLLSAGSPVRRVRLANIFGDYRYNVVSFTNHRVHPGSASTFEDISIDGVFCSKSAEGMKVDVNSSGPACIWIDGPAVVSSLTISDYHRTESVWAAENILISPGATVETLLLSNVSLVNRTPGAIDVLTNQGKIGCLGMANVCARAEGGTPRGAVLRGAGAVRQQSRQQVLSVNLEPEKETPIEK